jgi:hypothetical protein
MISPTHIRVNEYRYQDLRAEVARARLVRSAASADPAGAKPSPVGRLRAVARQVLASLGSASPAFGGNKRAAA